MSDKRKHIRFKADKKAHAFFNEIKVNILDMSLTGLKTDEIDILIGDVFDIDFFYENNNIGFLKVKKVNKQGNNSGLEILDSPHEYKEIFNPIHLIKKIKIKKSQDFIEYSDANSSLFFKFFYNEEKQIFKTLIFFRKIGLELSSDSIKTYKDIDCPDSIPNSKTIEMFKSIVQNSSCFVSSFKDWLLDSLNSVKK